MWTAQRLGKNWEKNKGEGDTWAILVAQKRKKGQEKESNWWEEAGRIWRVSRRGEVTKVFGLIIGLTIL